MILMPDPSTAILDPFFEETTVNLRCDIVELRPCRATSATRARSPSAPRPTSSRRHRDASVWGPENEFFIFDNVRHGSSMNGCFYEVDSMQGSWNTGRDMDGGNLGHRPGVKGGYFPVPPVDAYRTCAPRCASRWRRWPQGRGAPLGGRHRRPGRDQRRREHAGEEGRRGADPQVRDPQRWAASYGKSATFMPKPLVGDNGNGMHVNQSLAKDGKNLFGGDKYGGLSSSPSITSAASSSTPRR